MECPCNRGKCVTTFTFSTESEITKTHEERIVPLSLKVVDLIRKLLYYHSQEWTKATIFCTDLGKVMTTSAFRGRMKGVCIKQGIDITPYELRHIFATNFIRNGGDAFTLKTILGHTSISTTQI